MTFFGLWIMGFIWFFLRIPESPSQNYHQTDAIVVLTGGRDRIGTALDLLCQGRSHKLLISGVHPDENLQTVFRMPEVIRLKCASKLDHFKKQISLGYEAINTRGNARETLSWLERNKLDSLRLVTAAYHMQRALFVMESHRSSLKIIPHPVFPKGYSKWHFLSDKETTIVLLLEYHKLLRTLILGV